MPTDRYTIDYLKFVIKTDSDHFNEWYQHTFVNFNQYCRDHLPASAPMKCSITKTSDNGQRTYVLECWGAAADNFVEMAPPTWWEHMRRCDVREKLDNVTGDELLTVGASYILAPRSAITVRPISSPPRRKTNQRDIGGKGVYWGSRASEQHLVAYARGDEGSVLEYRAMDKHAAKIGKKVADNYPVAGGAIRREALINYMVEARQKFMSKHLGVDDAAGFAFQAQNLGKSCPPPAEWRTQVEMAFDEEWNQMTTEQQGEELSERWGLTSKGLGQAGK